jgi:alpha-glucosidase
MSVPWWRGAVVYQIYPRSFCDTSGDGVGDLEGIRRHLDHLVWLGVDAIWLSPFYRSPMADFGYDVADYCDVDPLFGTLDDFDRLLADAHDAGIRVLVDWVPNHTSDRHPWFVESRSSRHNPKREWYVWVDGSPDQPPNNWRAAFGGPAWTWDDATQQWYLHLFLPEQPDLNWRNPEVVAAMESTMRFWLDRGVDGFRIDVVHGLVKPEGFPDTPPEWEGMPHSALNDEPETHAVIRRLRRLVDGDEGDRVLVGEVFLLSTAQVATYYGDGDELHLAFNFTPIFRPWDAPTWRHTIARVEEEYAPHRGWPAWAFSNHDNKRVRTRLGGVEARARAAAVLLLTLRGTAFLYEGEELGLEDAVVPDERGVDPGGRDGARAPVPWTPEPGHGWAGDPWLPWPPDAEHHNASTEAAEPRSFAHLVRRLITLRRSSPALAEGDVAVLASPPDVLAYERAAGGGEAVLVLVNFADEVVDVPLEGRWTVELASDGAGEGRTHAGTLGPFQAVVLRPA